MTAGDTDSRAADDFGLEQSLADIRAFFRPRTGVALVGRIDITPGWMETYRSWGEHVKIGFVNPKGGDAGPLPVFRSVLELPEEFDTIVTRVSPERTAGVVRECGERGTRTVVVFANGFAETGPEGAAVQAALAQAAAEAGVRLMGPNTPTGVLERLELPPGNRGGLIGLITQSGANGRLLVQGVTMGAAFGQWVPTGNEADLEAADFLNYFAHEDAFSVVCMYVEGFKSIDRLKAALAQASERDKPVVILKIGATERGATAAVSHTGHLAGSDAVISGLFDQYGVTRVHDIDALLETANLFAKLPPGTGPGCALYSYSGGAAALMGEIAEAKGVAIPPLATETREELGRYIVSNFGVSNPIDNGGVLMHGTTEARLGALDAIASDPSIDIVVVGMGTGAGMFTEVMGRDLLDWAPRAQKPVVAVWAASSTDAPGYADLVASGVPIFHSFTRCFEALRDFARYQARRGSHRPRRRPHRELTPLQTQALNAEGVLTQQAAVQLVSEAGVRLARERLAPTAAAAGEIASQVGETVVLKITSPAFPHKTEAGLVKVGVPAERVAEVAGQLVARAHALEPEAVIDGVQIQELVTGGVEMIVGLSRDVQCGMCLTLGFGGIYAELLRDAVVRPLPVDEQDVREMIASLRLAPLLDGWRGAPPADKDALVRLALQVADLGLAAQGRLVELDLNPVMVLPDGAVAVDVLAVAGEA